MWMYQVVIIARGSGNCVGNFMSSPGLQWDVIMTIMLEKKEAENAGRNIVWKSGGHPESVKEIQWMKQPVKPKGDTDYRQHPV